jgi:multiple sugar transport system permease protein
MSDPQPVSITDTSHATQAVSPGTWKDWRWYFGNFLFTVPFLLLFGIFTLGPIFYSGYMSLFDWEILAKTHRFIGLQNYVSLMNDSLWWLSLRNTMLFAFLTAGGNAIFALLVALAVNQPLLGRDFFRVLFYAPVVLSVAVMAIILGWILNTQFGVLNYLLIWAGFAPIPWLSSPRFVIPMLSVTTVWWTFGFPMLIYLTGLQNIPDTYYEAARIDGAGRVQLFRHITLPLLRPIVMFVAITQLISHFKIFGQPYIMTEGGPGRSSFMVIMYLYQTAWRFYRVGYGASIAMSLALVILFFTVLQLRFFGAGSDDTN